MTCAANPGKSNDPSRKLHHRPVLVRPRRTRYHRSPACTGYRPHRSCGGGVMNLPSFIFGSVISLLLFVCLMGIAHVAERYDRIPVPPVSSHRGTACTGRRRSKRCSFDQLLFRGADHFLELLKGAGFTDAVADDLRCKSRKMLVHSECTMLGCPGRFRKKIPNRSGESDRSTTQGPLLTQGDFSCPSLTSLGATASGAF